MSSPKIFKYYATLLLGFFIALSSFAQSYIFRNYTTEDGLPHSKVFNVLQTNDGYIWIATEGGLSIYNGQYFSNKSTQDSLAESNASALAQDESGNVWIGHLNGGISVFNGTSFRSIKLPEGLNPKRIFSLFIDHEGTLWIGTLGSGVLAVAKDDRKTWNHVKSYTKADGLWDIVTGTFEDSQHKLWFVTDGGLMWFNAKEKSFTVFKHDEMPNFVITSITETKEKDLIFGTYQGGLVILHGKTNKIEIVNAGKGFPSNDIFSLYTDRDGVTWVGTWGAGIVKYHDKIMDHFSKNEGLSGNFIRCFFMDREGNQWIGTNESGVSCFKGKKFALFAKENGLPNPLVNALAIDPSGKIWVGTKDGLTIYRLAPDGSLRSASNVPLKELLNKDIRSLSYVGGGKILVGTNNAGAVLIDTARGAFKRGFVLPENIVNTLIGTRNGTIWFGTTAGITRFDEKTNSFKNYGSHDEFGGKDISDIIEDRNGKIWVACRNGGLTSMDPASEQFRHFSEKDGFTSKSPVSISEDSQGRLWIGTEGSGVFSFDGKTFRQYHIKDGLPSDFITFVKCEKEIVWVGTNKGISKFIPSKGTCRNYNTSDGLVNNETRTNAVASDAEGNIYFGTSQGMMRYSPALDTPNQIEPLTHITRFSVYLTEMNMKKDTVLDYTQHDISFEFIGLSFSGSENVRYKYKLEGYDEGWKGPTSQNGIPYTNLSFGSYSFLVQASNNEGVWNSTPTRFSFVITPPWYLTKIALAAYVILLIGGPIVYVRWRTRKLEKDKEILEQQVVERTLKIAQQNKQLEAANVEISLNRDEISEKNKDITDSIQYAKRIQNAILPPRTDIFYALPDAFIVYKPRDIVSGDFYWFYECIVEKRHIKIVVSADCTGHGVPGAFLTMIGNNMLNQIVIEANVTSPSKILFHLNNRIKFALRQAGVESETHDGMDISVCAIDESIRELKFSSANRPVYVIKNNTLETLTPDKTAIAGFTPDDYVYSEITVAAEGPTSFYMFSDGYADQFGGPNGKKFMTKKLKELLMSIQDKSMAEQGDIVGRTIEEWMSGFEQVDDITAFAVKI